MTYIPGGAVTVVAAAVDYTPANPAKWTDPDPTNVGAGLDKLAEQSVSSNGDMLKATYDSNADGKVNSADTADAVPWAGVGGKPSTYAPAAHHGNHEAGGSDAIKLDDLAAPDDTADLDASTTTHGLLPKLTGETDKFLRADGVYAAPPGGSGTDSVDLLQVSLYAQVFG